MKRFLIPAAALAALAVAVSSAGAAPVPFPSTQIKQVFIAAQVVTSNGTVASWFKPGATAIFRAYAVDGGTQKMVGKKDVKFFYVTIPGAANVKLAYNPKATGASTGIPWTGKWTIPATYPNGLVDFGVHVKLKSRKVGTFVQMPVATSQLNVSLTAPEPPGQGAPAGSLVAGKSAPSLSLYVDSINGTAPAGTSARPIGCTQTNVYSRGERMVVRAWGTDLKTTDVLSNDNVKEAHFTMAGQPTVSMAFGTHGLVQFWSAFWIVPADYPLGETVVHVTFTTLTGKTATFDYPINVIP
jgi:hypothetical protein